MLTKCLHTGVIARKGLLLMWQPGLGCCRCYSNFKICLLFDVMLPCCGLVNESRVFFLQTHSFYYGLFWQVWCQKVVEKTFYPINSLKAVTHFFHKTKIGTKAVSPCDLKKKKKMEAASVGSVALKICKNVNHRSKKEKEICFSWNAIFVQDLASNTAMQLIKPVIPNNSCLITGCLWYKSHFSHNPIWFLCTCTSACKSALCGCEYWIVRMS